MAWRPLRMLVATIIYLRGLGKREDIVDVDLLPGDDNFFDQTLGIPFGDRQRRGDRGSPLRGDESVDMRR